MHWQCEYPNEIFCWCNRTKQKKNTIRKAIGKYGLLRKMKRRENEEWELKEFEKLLSRSVRRKILVMLTHSPNTFSDAPNAFKIAFFTITNLLFDLKRPCNLPSPIQFDDSPNYNLDRLFDCTSKVIKWLKKLSNWLSPSQFSDSSFWNIVSPYLLSFQFLHFQPPA